MLGRRSALRVATLAALAALAMSGCERDHGAPFPTTPTTGWPPRSGFATDPSSAAAPARGPGCGRPPAHTGSFPKQRIAVAGNARTYTLVVPDRYDPNTPYPLIFALHGNGGSGAWSQKQFDLEHVAFGRAIAIYPDAQGGGWDLDKPTHENRDVAFFDALLFVAMNSLCVDARRVFVTGFSNGAYMANQLGCRRGDRIRAIVSHAGGGPFENAGRYDEQGHLICEGKPVAAMVVHGTSDTTVGPSEGQKSLDHWSFANRCGGASAPEQPAPCQARVGCAQAVVSCRIPGLGHTLWREARRATWAFFDAQR